MFSIFKNETYVTLFCGTLSSVVALFVGVLSIYVTRSSCKSSTARERLNAVYHPLFSAIEPFLYKEISSIDIASFFDLYVQLDSTYPLLISPALRHSVTLLRGASKPCLKSLWFDVCRILSNEYDHLCRQAHIPVRSASYRYNNKQYSSMLSLIFIFLRIQLPAIITFCAILGFLCPFLLLIALVLFLYVLLRAISDYS